MDPTCGLVERFRDLVFDLIGEHLLYLVNYGQNIEQLNERLAKLTLERISIQHRMDEATNNVERIEEKVLHWLHEVDEISEQVEQLRKEGQAKRECSITSCPNPWLRYKLSKRAKGMAKQAADILGNAKFDTVSYRLPPQSMPELTNGESNEGIDSRVPIIDQIMEALRNSSVKMIGLCGLGGVGKTTIAKEIAKNQKMFEKAIMVTVSNELNIENIQGQIAEALGLQLNEKTEEVRASRLRERLKEEENMLLILDDLWVELDLRKVGIPFLDVENNSKKNEGCKILPTSRNKKLLSEGCKILLTSRNKKLLSDLMKCQKIIEVSILSEDEAWELFKKIVEPSVDSSSPELMSIATDIVRKCGGLPLFIATLAKALRYKDLDEWKNALARLNHPLRRNITGIKEADPILKLSYDHLSSPEYKHIFLLASMLSHDPSIEDLLMYSMGLDFLEHTENIEDAYVGLSAIVSKLKSLNLFLDSFSRHHVTMHDVIRDVALPIASKELPAFIVRHRPLNEWPDEKKLEDFKGICLQESDLSVDLPEELHGPRLKFFLLNSTKRDLTIPKMFFKSSKELKVLAFTKVHFSSLPLLSYLKKLKTFCLHSCLLEDITEIRTLKNLKVLSLAYSEIERLPVELVQLTSLQMLNLSHCSKLKVIPEKLLSSFKKLEVLYMENSFDQWKVEGSSEVNENASLDELNDLPISSVVIHIPDVSMLPKNLFLAMNLKRYRILIGECWKRRRFNYENPKILKLELERGIHLKRGVEKLLVGVEDFHLYGSNGLGNVLYSHEGRGFPYLKHLRIENNDDIKYIVLNSSHHEGAFPILESLILEDLKALEKLCEGTSTIEFHQLRTLRMRNLPALIADPCLKDDATNSVSNEMLIPLFSKVLLPKLEILELRNLNIEQLSHNSLSNLKTLIVHGCAFVKLLPLHVLKYLKNLEELEIHDCVMLKMVFDFEDWNDYKEIESSSMVVPLKTLTLRNLPKLKNVWSNHNQGNVSFPSLRSVHVYDCESLTSIFLASSIAKGMIPNLEELRISQCGIDVIVANDQASESATPAFKFPRLTSLELSWLRKLRNFYPERHTLEWPNLQRLSIEYCDLFEIFRKEVLVLSEIHEKGSTLNSNYPLLSRDQVMHKLGELSLWGKHAEMIGSGQFPMYRFPNVKVLDLYVDEAATISYKSLWKSFPNLEQLQLRGDFEALETNDVAASFSTLTLSLLYSMRSLSPSLVSSQNLTHLKLINCFELTTLMASSTARSLVHITHLSISVCHAMEEIITKQEGENDEDKEIIFSKLKLLKFLNMPRLKRFCGYNYTFRFPLLEQITMMRCPKFQTFSSGLIDTPSLKSVQLSKEYGEEHLEIWDTNLNKTFNQQRFVASRKMMLDKYDASMIRNDQFPVESCSQVEILHIEGFVDDEWLTFPYTLLERFPKLKELHVKDCSFKELFPSHASLHNLTKLTVSKCHQLVYLVENSSAKCLVNLETLEISDCEKMEEIVKKESSEDVEREGIIFNGLRILKLDGLPRMKTEDTNLEDRAIGVRLRLLFDHNQVLLPKLEVLELSNLLNNSISLIWGEQLLHNSFKNLKTLIVRSCGSLKLVPLHVLKSLNKLEKLRVSECDMLEMVFGFEDLNDCKEMESSSVVVPLNLTHLEVQSCQGLTTLMTSSAAQSLAHLTHLSISYCCQIKEIITKREGEDEQDEEIVLNKLEFLELDSLPRLKRFCNHNYTFSFSLLERVTIKECPQLTMFCPGVIYAPLLKSIQVKNGFGLHIDIWMIDLNNTIQHRFTITEVISTTTSMALNANNITLIKGVLPKVMTLYVESFMDEGITFPYGSLERFPQLNSLYVEHCSFEEIFPSHNHIIDDFLEVIPQFKELRISHLDKLKSIWKDDSQRPPIHQNLEILEVESCCNLLKLAPSSASFQYLWNIKVSGCHQLIHLVTSSTAKSLVSLEWLRIKDCKNMEAILMNETNEDVEGVITFNRLSEIELIDMPSLKKFSSQSHSFELPKLKELKITGCPEMNLFCPGVLKTPKLSKVKIEEHDMAWKDEEDLDKMIQMLSSEEHDMAWKDEEDLNKTIQMLSSEKVISTTDNMVLNAENITVIKGVFPKVMTLYVESFMDEGVTFPYSSLKRFPQLNSLYVEHCSFEEIFPSHDHIIDDFLEVIPQFKELRIAHLDKLKSIWKDDSQQPPIHQNLEILEVESCCNLLKLAPSSASFQYLWNIKVSGCHQLLHLVTSSTAKSLGSLQWLEISDCKNMEEIIMSEINEEVEGAITFDQLWKIKLTDMPSLKKFSSQNHSFKFPKLKELKIMECPEMNLFCSGVLKTPKLSKVKIEEHDIAWKDEEDLNKTIRMLFSEKRFVSSKEVVLDEYDASMIRNDQFPVESCPQVEVLDIEGFVDDEWVTFPYTLLERFPGMKKLHVEGCSFEEIVPSHAPSLTSFCNLTELKVSKCHQLLYLVTNSTMKSLVNLETLQISDCEKMKEIVKKDSSEDVEKGGIIFNGLRILKLESLPTLKTEIFNIVDRAIGVGCKNISKSLFGHDKVLLPKLEVLELSNLVNNSISSIWDELFLYNSFSNLKTLIVQSCGSLKSVPFHVLKSLNKLEKLQLSKCDMLEMVFGFEDLNYCKEVESSSVVPLNLTHLEVESCQGLTTLMTSSAARSLVHLTHLSIRYCHQIKEIIAKQEGEDEEDKEIVFNKLEVISTTDSMVLNAENITVIKGVFPKVITLYVESFVDEGVTFPYSSLERFPQLNSLYVEHCSFKEIFPSHDHITDDFMEKIPPFKELRIANLDKLKTIWKDDSQPPPIHQNLAVLKVKSCCNLVKLAPSFASFQYLRQLSVSGCCQLTHLVTSSIAKSLVSLGRLKISDCKNLEEIVMNETNEDVEVAISFNELRKIELTDMPILKMFSSQSHSFQFPKLKELKITGCLEMNMFCPGLLKTPKLSKVKIEEHDMAWKDEEDLNKTIQVLSSAKEG